VLDDYEPAQTALRFDVEKARALLAEAGFPGGKGFPKIGILYNTLEMHRKIAEVISDQLRRNLGIEVQAYNQEWQSYLQTTRDLDYEMARGGWIGDYPDPNTFLDLWVTNGGNNRTGWSHATYDALLRLAGDIEPLVRDSEPWIERLKEPERVRTLLESYRGANTTTARLLARQKLRMAILREAEAILVQDEFPILPVYFYVNSGLIRKNVRGFYTKLELPQGRSGWNFQDIHPLRDIYLEGEGESRP
jgi:oligopeptide transport system substrate-binding protein